MSPELTGVGPSIVPFIIIALYATEVETEVFCVPVKISLVLILIEEIVIVVDPPPIEYPYNIA